MEVLSLFSAFTFAAICLIITEIADPSGFYVQSSLLFLSILFYISLYLLGDSLTRSLAYCKKRSMYSRHDFLSDVGVFVLFYLFGLVVAVIFLLWSLYVLFGISISVYAISSVAAAKLIILPFVQKRKLDKIAPE